jgi:ssDNA-binding Zn-finger/Zn-ribbon topoisomerase 1
MGVKHEIPKCPKCGKYMTLKNIEEDKIHGDNYVYYCDNENCGNNKVIKVVEGK